MDGKVDALASGPHTVRAKAAVMAANASPSEVGAHTATSSDAEVKVTPVVHAKPITPRKDEIPPNYVFAPGFMYADRRGLVPYPGLHLGPDTPLAAAAAQTATPAAQQAYGAVIQLRDDKS